MPKGICEVRKPKTVKPKVIGAAPVLQSSLAFRKKEIF